MQKYNKIKKIKKTTTTFNHPLRTNPLAHHEFYAAVDKMPNLCYNASEKTIIVLKTNNIAGVQNVKFCDKKNKKPKKITTI